MATRPKAIIESHDGEEFSPITIAKNVLTDDGQNLQDILSDRKEDMMTPTIENSSSMFKVGQGDNVDYSENVVDGAYESCVLKGKSLVNIHDATTYTLACQSSGWYDNYVSAKNEVSFTIVDNTFVGWYYINLGTLNLTMLKPNTKYLIVFSEAKNISTVRFLNKDGTKLLTDQVAVRDGKAIVTTNANMELDEQVLYVYFSIQLGEVVVKNAMIIEYQEGMENWDIPYFEGLCDVKSPILTNVGKNLFNPQKIIFPTNVTNLSIEGNCVYIADGTLNGWREIQMTASLPIGTYYVDILENGNFIEGRNGLWVRGVGATMLANVSNRQVFTITEPAVRIDLVIQNASNLTFNNTQYSIHIENANTAPLVHSSHEPYKSNILSCETYFDETTQSDKTIVLRSLPNGVCDTLNVETGEYVQRIGEIALDGSSSEEWQGSSSVNNNDDLIRFYTGNRLGIAPSDTVNFYCDKFKVVDRNKADSSGECVFNNSKTGGFPNGIQFQASREKATTLEEWKQYLSQNPATIHYPMITPITKTVDISGYPFAYKDGHVILSSSSIEQSLLPTIEYSVATNRNGQVRSNQKMVERHQKELDHLQAMVLANLVNTQYRQTLMKLKNDLKSEVRV